MEKTKRYISQKLHEELGLEHLKQWRWMRRLGLFSKVLLTKIRADMYDFLSTVRQFQGDPNTFNFFSYRTEYFKTFFFFALLLNWISQTLCFISVVWEWNLPLNTFYVAISLIICGWTIERIYTVTFLQLEIKILQISYCTVIKFVETTNQIKWF